MTMPNERYSAINRTRQLLQELQSNPRRYSADELRQQVRRCLKHFPGEYHVNILADLSPDILTKE